MSSLLKDRYTKAYVERVARAVATVWHGFDAVGYTRAVLGEGWTDLELKARMRRLSSMLHRFLPMPYARQIAVLQKAAPPFGGFEGMFFPDFVEQFGLEHFETSIRALQWFTQFSSSEFAVRPFIVRYPDRMLAVARRWASHDNEHVRRLASEGCRPRLPWAMALPGFQRDPSPVLPILESLKHDPSDSVRRSVANHLNDIAKDHPKVVLDIARRWLGNNSQTDRLIKHACRTLLKQGDPRALALFGYDHAEPVTVTGFKLSASTLRIGDDLKFQFAVSHRAKRPIPLRLEYAVDFVKASGRTTRKVFKIAEILLPSGRPRHFKRAHPFRDFTTRKHHPGRHPLSILVNGKTSAHKYLLLTQSR